MKSIKIHKISRSGFRVPDQYFESFKVNEQLDNYSTLNDTGFLVPENYFNNFDRRSTDKKTKISSFSTKKYVYVAASLLIFILFKLVLISDSNDDYLENYVINENIDSYDISNLLSQEELPLIDTSDLLNEAVETFLIENDISVYLLNN